MGGKASRTKGHSFERWVSKKIRGIFPQAKRKLEYQTEEAKGIDVENAGPYLIQCKRGKRYASLRAIQEVQIDPIDGGIPVLITKGDHQEALAAIPFPHFLELVRSFYSK